MWSPNVSVSSDEAGDQLFSRRKLCLSARNAGEGWVRHVALLQISLLHKYTYNKPDHTRKVHKNGHNQLLQGFLTSEWSLGLEDDHLTKKKRKDFWHMPSHPVRNSGSLSVWRKKKWRNSSGQIKPSENSSLELLLFENCSWKQCDWDIPSMTVCSSTSSINTGWGIPPDFGYSVHKNVHAFGRYKCI